MAGQRQAHQTHSADAESPATEVESTSPPPADDRSRRRTVDVVCKRAFRGFTVGQKLAEVELDAGVDLNTLVDAVRNGLAGDAPNR